MMAEEVNNLRKSLAILNSYRAILRNYIGEEPNKIAQSHFSGQVFCRYIQDFTLERAF